MDGWKAVTLELRARLVPQDKACHRCGSGALYACLKTAMAPLPRPLSHPQGLMRSFTRTALAVLVSACVFAPGLEAQSPDHQAVAAAVAGFHAALARGDSAAVLALLAPDVRIMEAGGVETLEAYRSGHLASDIEYAKAVPSTRSGVNVTISGDVAWVTSESRTVGTFRDRPVNSAGAELMVLARSAGAWRIRAIHWSSRTIRTP